MTWLYNISTGTLFHDGEYAGAVPEDDGQTGGMRNEMKRRL